MVRDTIKQVNINHGDSILQSKYLDYHQIQPTSDGKTKKLMSSGRTMGVFYIESPSIRQLMAKAGIVNFEHIIIFSSIIRPAANRFISLMLDRIHGGLRHQQTSFHNPEIQDQHPTNTNTKISNQNHTNQPL